MDDERNNSLIEERNILFSQHQSDRDQWLEENNSELDYQLDYALAVRENEYKMKTEKHNEWRF